LDKNRVIAGGILHDFGKSREMEQPPEGTGHTAEASLIGHILIGRDMVRNAAAGAFLHIQPNMAKVSLATAGWMTG
jgi:3'-5' exoribonuclease